MIVNDPSLVMIAFKQAHRYARTPGARRRVARAYNDWSQTAGIGGASVGAAAGTFVGNAVGCACRHNVQGLLLAGVGDVTAAQVQANAEASAGRPLTPAEEQVVEQAVAIAQAPQVTDESMYEWIRQHAPTTIAYNAAVQAASDMRTAMGETATAAKDAVLEVSKQSAENVVTVLKPLTAPAERLVDTMDRGQKSGEKIAWALVIGGIGLGALWILTNKGSSR